MVIESQGSFLLSLKLLEDKTPGILEAHHLNNGFGGGMRLDEPAGWIGPVVVDEGNSYYSTLSVTGFDLERGKVWHEPDGYGDRQSSGIVRCYYNMKMHSVYDHFNRLLRQLNNSQIPQDLTPVQMVDLVLYYSNDILNVCNYG